MFAPIKSTSETVLHHRVEVAFTA